MKKVFKLNELQTAYMEKMLSENLLRRNRNKIPEDGSLLLGNIELARTKSKLGQKAGNHSSHSVTNSVDVIANAIDHPSDLAAIHRSHHSKKRTLEQDELESNSPAKSRHAETSHSDTENGTCKVHIRFETAVDEPRNKAQENLVTSDSCSIMDRSNLPRTPSCVVEGEWGCNVHSCQTPSSEQISGVDSFNLTIDL